MIIFVNPYQNLDSLFTKLKTLKPHDLVIVLVHYTVSLASYILELLKLSDDLDFTFIYNPSNICQWSPSNYSHMIDPMLYEQDLRYKLIKACNSQTQIQDNYQNLVLDFDHMYVVQDISTNTVSSLQPIKNEQNDKNYIEWYNQTNNQYLTQDEIKNRIKNDKDTLIHLTQTSQECLDIHSIHHFVIKNLKHVSSHRLLPSDQNFLMNISNEIVSLNPDSIIHHYDPYRLKGKYSIKFDVYS